jgi:AraC-like DNA-binding protein
MIVAVRIRKIVMRRAKENEFAPLIRALQTIQFSLESPSPPHVLLAAQTREEFIAQRVPSHCKVTPRKLRGTRVRPRRKAGSNPALIAQWPDDGLAEGLSPTLLVVLSGEADIQIADYTVSCREGDVLFLPAHIPKFEGSRVHYEKVTPESHCDLLIMNFLAVGLHSLEAYICHSRGSLHTMGEAGERCWLVSREITLIFETMAEIAQHGAGPESAFYLFASVISLLKHNLESGKCFSPRDFPSQSLSMENYSPISKAKEYMKNHLYTPLSIDLVARWVGLSRNVFVQQFRRESGESFHEFLTRQRLEQAKVLLLQSNLSIEVISSRVGVSPGQLRNLFHENAHCTPRDFRQNARKVRI